MLKYDLVQFPEWILSLCLMQQLVELGSYSDTPNSSLPENTTAQVPPFLHLLELLPVSGVVIFK